MNTARSIFITGAASGIGAATARKFAAEGWFPILADIDAAGLAGLQQELGPTRCLSVHLDVRNPDNWLESMEKTAERTGGRLDLLFNNAGIAIAGPFESIPLQNALKIIDVNLKGVINGIYAALPLLEKTPAARIINVSSVAGIIAAPGLSVYSATKWAVRGLTESLDVELRPRDIRVVSLCPWFMDTPMLNAAVPRGRNRAGRDALRDLGIDVYPVELAAETAWKAAFGDALHYTVGKRATQASLTMRVMPELVRARARKGWRPPGSAQD
jgi:NAD(P)-dependent dehydrogenase (short-subunit alcohol dehydrogenase family)